MSSMKKIVLLFGLLAAGMAISSSATAGDIEWSGMYRIEGNSIYNPFLDTSVARHKEYGVQTLILRPRLVAADGLYIYSQFNIFNSPSSIGGNNLGAIFGDGVGASNGKQGSGPEDSSALSTHEKTEQLAVTEFYMKMVQEFGTLIVGRAPINFGLGMSYSDGSGLFDHYIDTRDMVGYKIDIGNLYLLPMYGKVSEGGISNPDDIQEFDLEAQYENPDIDSSIGVMYSNRTASPAANDIPQYAVSSTAQPTTVQADKMDTKNFNIFFKKSTTNYNIGFELSQQSGNLGVDNSSGTNVKLSGFGAVMEYNYTPQQSKWALGLKGGFATGDDPKTDDQYEGFIFNRNYDVAMLLFNQPLGQADILHTALYGRHDMAGNAGSAPTQTNVSAVDTADTEALSNVYYVSPSVTRKWNDKWSTTATLVGAWLNNSTVAEGDPTVGNGITYTSTGKDLGYEVDLSMNYKISDKIVWNNEFGYLIPGSAWKVNGQFNSDASYGLVSKAAVSF